MASIKINKNVAGDIVSYRLRADLGRDPSGKQIVKTMTIKRDPSITPARELKLVQRKADDWEMGLKKGLVPLEKISFKNFLESDFFGHVCADMKPNTIAFYRNLSRRPLKYFGTMPINAITTRNIEHFLYDLRQQGELSEKSLKHEFDFLRLVFNSAERLNLIERNPIKNVVAPRVTSKKPRFLDAEESKNFLSVLQQTAPLRWQAIMTTLLMLGLRRGELCALRWENFDFNLKIVHVKSGVVYTPETGLIVADPKTKLSVRDLPLADSLIQLLKSWRKEQSALLKVELLPTAFAFAGAENPYQPPRPDSVSRWLRNFSRRNNLPEGLSPHILRHSCASLLIAAGASVKDTQDFLGHSDPETTLKFYAATTQDRLDAAGNALANILDL